MNATKMRYNMRYENLQQGIFDSAGKYNIPIINKIEIDEIPELISFNYAKIEKNRKDKGVHFFLDDYQFFRVWNTPCNYLDMLKNFKFVFSPDFSLYTDFPVALQIYNHYRKHWLGAFWQKHGIDVIPTIGWGDANSFEWCFDGEPIGGTVAVSSIGTQKGKLQKELFLKGYNKMLELLKPKNIIFYGKIPKECNGNIIHIDSFQEKYRKNISMTE